MADMGSYLQLCCPTVSVPARAVLEVQGDNLVTCYLADVRSQLQLRSLATGSLKQSISLPGIGSINSFTGRREDSEFFFSFSSFANPGAIYRSAAPAADGCCLWQMLL